MLRERYNLPSEKIMRLMKDSEKRLISLAPVYCLSYTIESFVGHVYGLYIRNAGE